MSGPEKSFEPRSGETRAGLEPLEDAPKTRILGWWPYVTPRWRAFFPLGKGMSLDHAAACDRKRAESLEPNLIGGLLVRSRVKHEICDAVA